VHVPSLDLPWPTQEGDSAEQQHGGGLSFVTPLFAGLGAFGLILRFDSPVGEVWAQASE